MNRALKRVLVLALLILAGLACAGTWLQRHAAAALTRELQLLREEDQHLGALRRENARLNAERVSDDDLVRLRADRSALLRLKREVDELRARVEQRAQRVE